jgi:hypothetical protein
MNRRTLVVANMERARQVRWTGALVAAVAAVSVASAAADPAPPTTATSTPPTSTVGTTPTTPVPDPPCKIPKLVKGNPVYTASVLLLSQNCGPAGLVSAKGKLITRDSSDPKYLVEAYLLSRTDARKLKVSTAKPVGKKYVVVKTGTKLPTGTDTYIQVTRADSKTKAGHGK